MLRPGPSHSRRIHGEARRRSTLDAAPETPFALHLATGLARSAQRWSSSGKPILTGEVLAVGVQIWSVKGRSGDGLSTEPDSPFLAGISAAAYELVREQRAGEAEPRTRASLARELKRSLGSEETAQIVLDMIDHAKESFDESGD
jgi:hypothetical protein